MASFRRRAASASGGKLNDLRKNRKSVDFGRPGALQSLSDIHATQKWRQDDRSAVMASSAKKILEALTRTGRENKALVADRKPVSPLGPPPSSLKRARDDDDEDLRATEKRLRRSAADSGANITASFARGPNQQRISRPSPSPPNVRGERDDNFQQTQDVLASADKKRRLFSDGESRSNKRRSMSSAHELENDIEDVMERVSNRKRRTISYGAASNLGSAFKAYALAQSKAEAERKSGYGTVSLKPTLAPRKEPEHNARASDRDDEKIEKTRSANNPRASSRKEDFSNGGDSEPSAKRPSRANMSSFAFGDKKQEEGKEVPKSFSFSSATADKPSASSGSKEDPSANNLSKPKSVEREEIVNLADKVSSAPKKPNPILSKSPPDNSKKLSKAVTFAVGDSFAVPAPEDRTTENQKSTPSTSDVPDSGKSAVQESTPNDSGKVESKEQATKPLPVFTIPDQSTAKAPANKEIAVAPSTSVPTASNSVAMFNVPPVSFVTPFGSTSAPKAPSSTSVPTTAPVEKEETKQPPMESKEIASVPPSGPFQVKAPVPATEKVNKELEVAPKQATASAVTFNSLKPPLSVSSAEATSAPAAPFALNPFVSKPSTGAVEAAKDTKASSLPDTPKLVFGVSAAASNVAADAKKAPEPANRNSTFGQVPLGAGSGSSFPVLSATNSAKTGFGAAASSSAAKPSFPVPAFGFTASKPAEPEAKPFGFTNSKPAASGFGSSSGAPFSSSASAAFGQAKSTFPTPAATGFAAPGSNTSGSQGMFAFSSQSSSAGAAPVSSQMGTMSSPPSQSTPAFGTSSFGQPAAASAPTPGNPFSAPGSTAFGGSSAFPSQTANQGAPKNPFGPTSSGGDGPSNGPFGSFPSSFNPSAGPPAQTYTFGATVPPASSTGASVRTGFGGAAGALSASAPFGGSSNTMSFSTPSSGPAATAFGSATGMGGAFGFGATPNQSAPSGFGVAQPRFGAPTFGGSGPGTQPFGASSQATQALFGTPAMGASAPGDGFSIGSQATQPAPIRGRKYLRARRRK